jgi:hypothetical protein
MARRLGSNARRQTGPVPNNPSILLLPFFEYLQACTRPQDRLLFTWYSPELYIVAKRDLPAITGGSTGACPTGSRPARSLACVRSECHSSLFRCPGKHGCRKATRKSGATSRTGTSRWRPSHQAMQGATKSSGSRAGRGQVRTHKRAGLAFGSWLTAAQDDLVTVCNASNRSDLAAHFV